MCRLRYLRALVLLASVIALLVLASCGMNPQPEPPSADEQGTAGSGGAGGNGSGGRIGSGKGGDAGSAGGFANSPPGDDGGSSRSGQIATDENNNGNYSDPGDLGPALGALNDAGADDVDGDSDVDAGREELPPTYDAGSVTN